MPRPLYKIEFPSRSKGTIQLPAGSQILKTGLQNKGEGDFIALWFLKPANDEAQTVDVKVANVPTGSSAPDGYRYIGTIHLNPGSPSEIVQHQFVDASAPVSFS